MGGTTLRNWQGNCAELANEIERVATQYGQPVKILNIESALPGGAVIPRYDCCQTWDWHRVAVVNGLVLDPWCPWVPRPPAEYVARVFPGQPILAELFDGDGPPEVVCDTLYLAAYREQTRANRAAPISAVADQTQARRPQ